MPFYCIPSETTGTLSSADSAQWSEWSHKGSTVLLATLLLRRYSSCPYFPLATRPGEESSLWRPQLRVNFQRFPFPFSGQLRASRSAHANVLPIPQPQLPESHSGWLFPRWRHSIHRLRLLSTSDWHHCSHLQHQHWWVTGCKANGNLPQN